MNPSHITTPRCMSDATFSTGYPMSRGYRRSRPYGRTAFVLFVILALAFIGGAL